MKCVLAFLFISSVAFAGGVINGEDYPSEHRAHCTKEALAGGAKVMIVALGQCVAYTEAGKAAKCAKVDFDKVLAAQVMTMKITYRECMRENRYAGGNENVTKKQKQRS